MNNLPRRVVDSPICPFVNIRAGYSVLESPAEDRHYGSTVALRAVYSADGTSTALVPHVSLVEEALRRSGANTEMWVTLYRIFQEGRLPPPTMTMDIP